MKLTPILGLMSGTSMDGIDACILNTDGINFKRTDTNIISPYSFETSDMLEKLLEYPESILTNIDLQSKLEYLITRDHILVVKKILKIQKILPSYIGFHGQTIFHNAFKKISIQLGNGQLLANETRIKVVYNFRKNDIDNGGQGAPIAPVYHKALIKQLKLALPTCFVNIGGISNISYWDGEVLIGFDIGPGNTLIDTFVKKKFNINFDNNGNIAKLGTSNEAIIKKFMNNNFFSLSYPKSLDKLDFNYIFHDEDFKKLSDYDAVTTLTHLTIHSINHSLNQLPKQIKTIIIAGGGQHNKYLLKGLKNKINCNIYSSNEINIPGDMIEAELIAFLTARHVKKLNLTFPQTTGVKEPVRGGIIAFPN